MFRGGTLSPGTRHTLSSGLFLLKSFTVSLSQQLGVLGCLFFSVLSPLVLLTEKFSLLIQPPWCD